MSRRRKFFSPYQRVALSRRGKHYEIVLDDALHFFPPKRTHIIFVSRKLLEKLYKQIEKELEQDGN